MQTNLSDMRQGNYKNDDLVMIILNRSHPILLAILGNARE